MDATLAFGLRPTSLYRHRFRPRSPYVEYRLLLRRFVVLRHFGPVDDVPDRLQIIRATILVFEIVGVFPNIHAQDGFAFTAGDGSAHERAVLVGGGNNLQSAIADDQPGPTASEAAHTRGFKFFLERVETSEGGV